MLSEIEVDERTAGGEVTRRKREEVFPFADSVLGVLFAEEGFGKVAARGVVVGRDAHGFPIFGELGERVVLREIESSEGEVKVGVPRLEAHGFLKLFADAFEVAEERVLGCDVEPSAGEVGALL